MATWRYVCNSLLENLKQIEVTSNIKLSHVVYWTSIVANRLRHQQIKKRHTGAYLEIFDNLPIVSQVSSTTQNLIAGRKYSVLPKDIYDLDNDNGIDYINYFLPGNDGFKRIPFTRTTPSEAHRLYMGPYEKPTPQNPYYYRVHQYIYYLGIENIAAISGEMGLYTTIDTHSNLVSLDDELDLTADQIAILEYEIFNLGRAVLMIPRDRLNDGTDTATFQPKQAITPQATQEQNAE